MFEELSGPDLVRRCVQDVTRKEGSEKDFRTGCHCDIVHSLTTWITNGFKIVFDAMNFGHTVGGVELQEESISQQLQTPRKNIKCEGR
jgi:thiamine-triphosphatase